MPWKHFLPGHSRQIPVWCENVLFSSWSVFSPTPFKSIFTPFKYIHCLSQSEPGTHNILSHLLKFKPTKQLIQAQNTQLSPKHTKTALVHEPGILWHATTSERQRCKLSPQYKIFLNLWKSSPGNAIIPPPLWISHPSLPKRSHSTSQWLTSVMAELLAALSTGSFKHWSQWLTCESHCSSCMQNNRWGG